MAIMQDRETFGRARLSFAKETDIDEFVALLARFESGDIGPDEWRAFRLLRGTYGQRQTGDAQMMRIKIPQGILVREQLDVLATVAERYSRGFGHITTRQNVQLHFVKLHDAEPAMRELAAAGMTTREYLLFTWSVFQNGMAAWAVSQPGGKLPPGASMANVNFYRKHEAALKQLGPSAPDDCADDGGGDDGGADDGMDDE